MKFDDLNIQELVHFDTSAGVVRVAGQRAVIIDAMALGSLRKQLIESLGATAARGILTAFGYVQGWRMAETMGHRFQWNTDDDQRRAGGVIPVLEGMYALDPEHADPLSAAGATLFGSYEAEQHVAHLGRSDTTVCWTLCGLTSGYLSRALGQEIFAVEDCCIGRGDAACHLLGRTRAEWGDERAEELRFFHVQQLEPWLDASLHQITTSLKDVEQRLLERARALSHVALDVEEPFGIVARSSTMRRLIDLARRIATVDSTVLITGESGTGKERVARFVHDQSTRKRGPFIAVNCGAITESLLESELFGHARGSFTGAVQDRPGLFEAANGGTLLLDEIGEIPIGMQVKLLRALQEREVRRVGENQVRSFNVRVIAATNRELIDDIAAGRFRRDLYYRLNVVELHMPALRDRREDILPLARILLAEAALRLKRPTAGLSPRAADQLLRYDWPGNVRELQNAMERAVALARTNNTDVDDLPEEVRQAIAIPGVSGVVRPLDAIERDYILAVLDRNEGNQTRTAEQLGVGSATLYRKLKQYGHVRAKPRTNARKPE